MGQSIERNPLTDLLFHGLHPFPVPIEEAVLRIHRADPRAWRELKGPAEAWANIQTEERCGRIVEYLDRIARQLGARSNH